MTGSSRPSRSRSPPEATEKPACAPASAVLVIAQPWLLKLAIDDHIVPGDVAGLRTVALAYLGAVLLAFVLEATYVVTLSYAAIRTSPRYTSAGVA